MAGFFGLFDYNKPGPGVDKNGPQKKGIVIFFELYFRKFWKLILANLLYVLVSLPVVTTGFANAGLTYITRNFVREKHAFIYSDFMDTIKKNWKQALPLGLLNLVFGAIIAFDVYFFWFYTEGFFGMIGLAVSFMLVILYSFMNYYIYLMMITFKLTIKQLLKNALLLAFVGLGRNLLVSVVLLFFYAIGIVILFYVPLYICLPILLFVYILVFPAFRSFLIQFNMFPVIQKFIIDPYYKDHPGEDREAKRALNIEDEEMAAEDEEEAIFQDLGNEQREEEEETAPKRELPKQYNEQELLRSQYYRRRSGGSADDDTI